MQSYGSDFIFTSSTSAVSPLSSQNLGRPFLTFLFPSFFFLDSSGKPWLLRHVLLLSTGRTGHSTPLPKKHGSKRDDGDDDEGIENFFSSCSCSVMSDSSVIKYYEYVFTVLLSRS